MHDVCVRFSYVRRADKELVSCKIRWIKLNIRLSVIIYFYVSLHCSVKEEDAVLGMAVLCINNTSQVNPRSSYIFF